MRQKRLFLKAGLLAVILVSATIISWEMYLRHQGNPISYDDGGSLWSDKRKQVYEPINKATVFIGSSRIKYDLDIPTWEKLTGDHAIQLANVGSSPRLILEDLANDSNFRGKLVIDATEFLFFSPDPRANQTPSENLEYYKKETPAQRFSFVINRALESKFVFLDKQNFSLNALISNKIPNRPNVYEFPDFPADFEPVTFERQSYMTDKLCSDTNGLNQVKAVWAMFGKMAAAAPPITDDFVDTIIASVKTACDKIKARGGKVMFVRPPSSGAFYAFEKTAFSRERFWNKLLLRTGNDGIFFEDYAAIAYFQCPELSHLSVPQAVSYTTSIVDILKNKGWRFPKSNQNTTNSTTAKI